MKVTVVSVALIFGLASLAIADLPKKAEQTVLVLLERCVVASVNQGSAAFDDWSFEKGATPRAYLSFERFLAPDLSFQANVAQRRDKPGQPFTCRIIRSDTAGAVLSSKKPDQDLRRFIAELPNQMELGGVQFTRGKPFKYDQNKNALAACINGQTLVLSADSVVRTGATFFGVGIPLLEDLAC